MSGLASFRRNAAKVLRIKLDDNDASRSGVTRGESVQSTDTYIEDEPTVGEWISEHLPKKHNISEFFWSLFPFLSWIGRYNTTWLYGDTVAGVTVGFVVIPQSMAYAKLALLAPEFGLYSSFVGVMIYWFFATSKDITIGPVAVMSTLVGNIVEKAADRNAAYDANVVASCLAVICGCIVFALGLLRLGFIVDYIPLPAIAAFMTGSALNIAMGQFPVLFGLSNVKNREATYKVFISFWKHIGQTKLDAALGLSALFLLYFIRTLANRMSKRYPAQQKTWFFISTLRTAFTILLFTMVSWLVNRHRRATPAFRIVQTVPRGFKHMGVPTVNKDIIKTFASELPAAVIVLLIEHIAISKSFGRINNYSINPSQELIAIGITNIFGPFFGAYPATGSFSRTAIKAKAGVRTPLAGVITGVIVLLGIYALTAVFYYIPNSALAAVIIHAVGDLITPPNTVYRFWRVSPLEVIIFFAGVIVTVFTTIEDGIYVTIATSGGLLLWRIAKARGHFLGRVKVTSVIGDHFLQDNDRLHESESDSINKTQTNVVGRSLNNDSSRNVFLPIDHRDGSNPEISLDSPYPGIFVYRFSEGFLYPNANHYTDQLVNYITQVTRRTNPLSYPRLGDRPWNDPGPRHPERDTTKLEDRRPTLRAVILDFSSVNHVDITSVQLLIDIRNQLDRHAAPEHVDWHFAAVKNRWTKRALASAGFGYPSDSDQDVNDGTKRSQWKPVFSVAEIGAGRPSAVQQSSPSRVSDEDLKADRDQEAQVPLQGKRRVPVNSINRPMFHVDVDSALTAAVENAR